MWNGIKLCLAAIIFTAVCCKGTAQTTAKLLDAMYADVVDDLYDGCREKAMDTFIHSGLLQQELNNSKEFQKAWSANAQCSAPIPGGIKEHTAALSVYYHGDASFLETLDRAVETMGVNVSIYENDFHFKSLHFLLMDSMTLLKKKECKTAYLVPENNPIKPAKGSTVRFGSFISVYSNYEWVARNLDLDGAVLYNITSCFFVNPGDHICSENKDELLLSPAEVFTVEEVAQRKDEDEFTEIVLKHSKLYSTHNCFSFSRSAAVVSTQWLVSVLAALLFFL